MARLLLKEELEELYLHRGLSMGMIAKELHTSPNKVVYFINLYQLKKDANQIEEMRKKRISEGLARAYAEGIRTPSIPTEQFKYANVGKFGEEAGAWKGGRFTDPTHSYVHIWIPDEQCYQLEHRLVMEKHLGRKLARNEHAHHINGIKTDNRIENLQVMSASDHARLHHLGRKRKPFIPASP